MEGKGRIYIGYMWVYLNMIVCLSCEIIWTFPPPVCSWTGFTFRTIWLKFGFYLWLQRKREKGVKTDVICIGSGGCYLATPVTGAKTSVVVFRCCISRGWKPSRWFCCLRITSLCILRSWRWSTAFCLQASEWFPVKEKKIKCKNHSSNVTLCTVAFQSLCGMGFTEGTG